MMPNFSRGGERFGGGSSSSGNSGTDNPPVNSATSGFFKSQSGRMIEIREVWASNLDKEFENIREIVTKYPYVAMDTEFPGIVVHPTGEYSSADTQYQKLRLNVDMLKLIQLGLTFTDAEGNFVEGGCTCWQFNFQFALSVDTYANDSIELLKTSGIDFASFEQYGISHARFGELMMMSGLVLNDEVKWLTFHSSFDFGYLVKTLTGAKLPADEAAFMEVFHTYFPCAYDIKYMMQSVEGLYGGLSALADTLEVERIGPMHQAGSDSLLTSQTYFKLVQKYFLASSKYALTPSSGASAVAAGYDDSKFVGELFGIGNSIYGNASQGASKYSTNSGTSTPALASSTSNGSSSSSSGGGALSKKNSSFSNLSGGGGGNGSSGGIAGGSYYQSGNW